MVTLDEYFCAKRKRDGAEVHRQMLARRIHELADRLADPAGVRPNEPMAARGPVRDYPVFDQDDWIPWEQIDIVIRAWAAADSEFREIEANLSSEQRRDLNRR